MTKLKKCPNKIDLKLRIEGLRELSKSIRKHRPNEILALRVMDIACAVENITDILEVLTKQDAIEVWNARR